MCYSLRSIPKLTFLQDGSLIRELPQFAEPVSSCVWAADGQSFVLGSFDKYNALCQWSLQGQKLHTWNEKNRTEDLAVSPDGHWLVAMDDLQHIYVYNFMTRELKYDMALGSRPTSLSISHDSRYLLVNTNITEALAIDLATRKSSVNTPNAELILFDLANRNAVQRYSGHSGGEYLIRSDFGGAHESFIICGSEGMSPIPHDRFCAVTDISYRRLHLRLAQNAWRCNCEIERSPATV